MRRIDRRLVVATILGLVLGSTAPAMANHKPSFPDGPTHAFGEMVDYPLAFPVGPGHTFAAARDGFWSNRYGKYVGPHHAADIMAPKMTPVYAAADGVVERVNWSRNPSDLNRRSCCSMIIEHDDGWESWYIHLNNDTPGTDDRQGWGIADGVVPGARVTAGQLVGWVGDSGNAEGTAPHLHFELRDPDGVWVNPHDSLKAALNGTPVRSSPPPPASSDPGPVLRPGDRGDAVADLQELLVDLGYDPGPADGVFGSKVASAVRTFQSDRGLAADGAVGPRTRAALDAEQDRLGSVGSTAPDDPTLRPGDRGDGVRRLQQDLTAAGHDPGPIDGVYGPGTIAAVRGFQRAAGLVVDGKAGRNTLARLAEAVDEADDPLPVDRPMLRRGDRGDAVGVVQTLLNEAGFPAGSVDGVFGWRTHAALVAFQRSNGLVGDGIAGPNTWGALGG
ncbi:MAG: peptidoglycan-binding protein [Acidimicrobiia bacterium]|nr:peptidoglycan-binding protein [Acidimicrobiia bacterium]